MKIIKWRGGGGAKINDVERNPKLRTYRDFKTTVKFEPYLNILYPKCRAAIARFRASSHDLEIERGRYTRPKTALEERKCKMCTDSPVEDEVHFLLKYLKYEKIRNSFLLKINTHIPHFGPLPSATEQFISDTNTAVVHLHPKRGVLCLYVYGCVWVHALFIHTLKDGLCQFVFYNKIIYISIKDIY